MSPQDAAARRAYVTQALGRYWPADATSILALDMASAGAPPEEPLPPRLVSVELPDWAHDIAVEGCILVPLQCLAQGTRTTAEWERVDWLSAAYWYLHGCAERAFEAARGPIHSYSSRLEGWDARLWERAWANRIALLLRRVAARQAGQSEEQLFGPRPRAEIVLAHDVDAVRKSWSLRAKQACFHAYNALRLLSQGRLHACAQRFGAAIRFAALSGDLWYFERVCALVSSYGLSTRFFFYGGSSEWRKLHLKLLDPAYDVHDARLAETVRTLRRRGHEIGLHQSYDSWRDASRMGAEKSRVEQALGASVTACRQHWLRFSWDETWEAQESAGLRLDATLGFNDRPGFRNGAALRFRPWSDRLGRALRLESIPMILMDSQLYDYADFTDEQRKTKIEQWMSEVRAVGGVASVNWHVHTVGPEYGWGDGLRTLLEAIARDT